jgi:hypothetical protein
MVTASQPIYTGWYSPMSRCRTALLTVAALGLTAGVAPAGSYSWNLAGSDNWATAGDWAPAGIPGAADSATIAVSSASAYTVTVNAAQAANAVLVNNANAALLNDSGANTFVVGGLTVSAGQFTQQSGTLSLGAAGAAVNGTGFFAFSNGAVTGAGPLTVANGGFSWDNGTVQTALNLNNGGALISGLGTKILGDGGALNMNGGTTTFLGNLKYSGPGTATVAAGATMNWTADAVVTKDTAYAGPAPFAINGTLFKSGGTGIGRFDPGLSITNTGTIQISSGTLRVDSDLANTGTLQADAGAEFQFRTGTLTLGGGSQITGAGVFHLVGGTSTSAVINMQVDTTASNFNFETGTVQGTNTLTVTGPLTWKQGVAGGSATVLATGGGSVTGSGTVASGTMNLSAGAFAWTAGNLTFAGNGTLRVGATATLTAAGDFNFSYSSGSPTLQIDGTVEKTAGTGTTSVQTGITVNNAGTLRVTSGTIAFQGSSTAHAVLNNTGTITVGAGAELFVNGGTVNLNPGTQVTGSGLLHVDNSNSTLTVNTAVTTPAGLTFVRGAVGGTGSLTVGGSFNWGVFDSNSLNGVTINAAGGGDWTSTGTRRIGTGTVNLTGGTFTWTSADIAFTDTGALTVGPGAVLNLTGGQSVTASAGSPTLTNNGTIRKSAGTGTGTIQPGVAFTNAGLFDVQSGTLKLESATVANNGTLNAGGAGTLTFDKAVALTGTGTVSTGAGGTLTVQVPTAATIAIPAGMTVTNAGTVQVLGGKLAIDNAAVMTDFAPATGTLSGGTWRAQGATLDLGTRAVATVAAGTTVEVNGSSASFPALAALTQNNGTVRVLNGATLTPVASNVNTAGLVEVGSGATFGQGVTVQSGGTLAGRGTVAGAVAVQSGGTVAPGSGTTPGPGVLTVGNTALAGGSTYIWELNSWSATPTAGTNFDQLKGPGGTRLDLSGASAGNRATLKIVSLGSNNAPGPIQAFDNTQARSWVIADFSNASSAGRVQGFTPDTFALDTTSFQNPLGGGSFSLSTDLLSNQLVLTFSPVPEPGSVLLVGGLAATGLAYLRRRK